jgi:hypothetical protein
MVEFLYFFVRQTTLSQTFPAKIWRPEEGIRSQVPLSHRCCQQLGTQLITHNTQNMVLNKLLLTPLRLI